jgi:hypothetical protein
LVVAFATSTSDLTWARFLTGFGIGGVVANDRSMPKWRPPRARNLHHLDVCRYHVRRHLPADRR